MKNMKMIYFASLVMISNLIVSCSDDGSKQSKDQLIVKVNTQEVGLTENEEQFTYSGSLEATNVVQVGFAVPGVVNQVKVQEGQSVQEGQLLASIDATEFSNALLIADAGLDQAEDMLKRMEELYKKGSLPEKDYIDIKSKVAQAKANKNINAKRISNSKLLAPMSGIVSSRQVEIGSTAAPGIPAFVIVKTDELYAKIAVPESEIGALKNGMSATISIPTLNEIVTGKITIINPQADNVSKSYSVKIVVKNLDGKLLPGMIANVSINTGKKIVLTAIPTSAIIKDADGLTYVFLAGENQKAIRKRVKLGNVTGSNNVVVLEGIAKGDQVIIAGVTNLKDGTLISL
ncbi:efflux RND transporter periplasmic adaptor subunit [Fluviicola taffensis]|uniref:efflux RND transporter periplasmic adaptor subunit n=1 Tax=Fluviicola taffensis TaxID=191579 RepID=UPI0031383498